MPSVLSHMVSFLCRLGLLRWVPDDVCNAGKIAEYIVRLDVGFCKILQCGFAGEHQDTRDSGIDADSYVRVEPVSHHSDVLVPEIVFFAQRINDACDLAYRQYSPGHAR